MGGEEGRLGGGIGGGGWGRRRGGGRGGGEGRRGGSGGGGAGGSNTGKGGGGVGEDAGVQALEGTVGSNTVYGVASRHLRGGEVPPALHPSPLNAPHIRSPPDVLGLERDIHPH